MCVKLAPLASSVVVHVCKTLLFGSSQFFYLAGPQQQVDCLAANGNLI